MKGGCRKGRRSEKGRLVMVDGGPQASACRERIGIDNVRRERSIGKRKTNKKAHSMCIHVMAAETSACACSIRAASDTEGNPDLVSFSSRSADYYKTCESQMLYPLRRPVS